MIRDLFFLDLNLASDPVNPDIDMNARLSPPSLRLSDSQRHSIRSLTRIRYADYLSFSTCLGVLSAQLVLHDHQCSADDLCIICVSSSSHVQVTSSLSVQLEKNYQKSGRLLINPIQFPSCLPSACPTTVSTKLMLHGPSLSLHYTSPDPSELVSFVQGFLSAYNLKSAILLFLSDASLVEHIGFNAQPIRFHPYDYAFALYCEANTSPSSTFMKAYKYHYTNRNNMSMSEEPPLDQ